MHVCNATKHCDMWDTWFFACEFLFKCYAMNYCCGCSTHDIDYGCYCFSPKVIWQILLIQHGMCYFYDVPIFPFKNSIMLWGVTTWILPLNSMFLQIFTEFIWKYVPPPLDLRHLMLTPFSFSTIGLKFKKCWNLSPLCFMK